jgi:hypothetical protein
MPKWLNCAGNILGGIREHFPPFLRLPPVQTRQ